jgi:hypothetical protein
VQQLLLRDHGLHGGEYVSIQGCIGGEVNLQACTHMKGA